MGLSRCGNASTALRAGAERDDPGSPKDVALERAHRTGRPVGVGDDSHQSALLCCDPIRGERLDNDPSGARYGCFLPDLTGLARRLPAPTSRRAIYAAACPASSPAAQRHTAESRHSIACPVAASATSTSSTGSMLKFSPENTRVASCTAARSSVSTIA